ncbi:MAG TPA: hypothetical protein VFX17_02000 [Patescibacteria group bacterium]|nr:hypothetical protein [Patescibacteria group bacterium]
MTNFTKALDGLCDLIIKHASPTRGEPPPKTHERRGAERPSHLPEFLDDVAVAKIRIVTNHASEAKCREWLCAILSEILLEAQCRCPAVPAYFEDALNYCHELKLPELAPWFRQINGHGDDFGQILSSHIRFAGAYAFEATHPRA